MIKIYHNQRCSKSRCTLDILKENSAEIDVIDYQVNPPSREELKDLLRMLNMKPLDLIRKGEDVYKENFKGKELSGEEWIGVMIKHPKLIERPIVVSNGQAVICRPPESVEKIL